MMKDGIKHDKKTPSNQKDEKQKSGKKCFLSNDVENSADTQGSAEPAGAADTHGAAMPPAAPDASCSAEKPAGAADTFEQAPGMEGFSREFKSPEHYITEITYKIWEENGLERIREWYAPDCIVRTPHGVTDSVEPIIQGTENTLKEFPDRQLFPEEIIIGLKEKGFYSSHRVRSTATHRGAGMFGPATGKEIYMLTIADCLCMDNQIVEEWLVRDQAAMAIQLGINPVDFGFAMGKKASEKYALEPEEMEKRWIDPHGLSIEGDASTANKVIKGFKALWGSKDYSSVTKNRHRALRFEGPGGKVTYGREKMVQLVSGILSAIPHGKFTIHHVIIHQDNDHPIRGAVRWSYSGLHEGQGRYGTPTGFPLTILGLSQLEIRNGVIVNEWMPVDDLAIWAQIAAWQTRDKAN